MASRTCCSYVGDFFDWNNPQREKTKEALLITSLESFFFRLKSEKNEKNTRGEWNSQCFPLVCSCHWIAQSRSMQPAYAKQSWTETQISMRSSTQEWWQLGSALESRHSLFTEKSPRPLDPLTKALHRFGRRNEKRAPAGMKIVEEGQLTVV